MREAMWGRCRAGRAGRTRRHDRVAPKQRRVSSIVLAGVIISLLLSSVLSIALWDASSRAIADDIAVNPQPFTLFTPTETTRNLTTEEIRHFIRGNCKVIEEMVLGVWLPMARVDARTHTNTLHVAFVGDSLCYRQFRFTLTDIDVCLNHLSPLQPTMVNCRESRAPTEAKAVFMLHHGTGGGRGGMPNAPRSEPASPVATLSPQATSSAQKNQETTGMARVRGWTRLIISYRRVRYAVELREVLESLYLPLDRPTAVASTHEPSGLTGWPLFPTLPAPQILYTGVGTWDITRPNRTWDGFDQVERDWYFANDAYAREMERFTAHMRANFSKPLTSLLVSWSAGTAATATAARRDRVAATVPAVSPPPRFYVLSVAPRVNCSSPKFQPRQPSGPQDVYQHLLTTERCRRLLLPSFHTVRGAFRETTATLPTWVSGDGVASATNIRLLDWGDDDNACKRSDGVHLDDLALECRKYIWRTFWGLFRS